MKTEEMRAWRHSLKPPRWRAPCIAAMAIALGCASPALPPTPQPPEAPTQQPVPATAVPEAARPAPEQTSPCERILSIDVYKSTRRLEARCTGGAVRHMTVALGREPAGHKQSMGDLRTPEGLYHVVGPMQPSRFHGFIPISYPSPLDAEQALASGRISAGDHRRILAAHQRGDPPPPETPIGGRIGFHGEGKRWKGHSEHLDWTYGCLALRDAELEFLAERLAPGTPVHIVP